MDSVTPVNQKIQFAKYTAIFVAGFTIGILFSGVITKMNSSTQAVVEKTNESHSNLEAKKPVTSITQLPPQVVNPEVLSITGIVQSIASGTITLKTNLSADPKLTMRTINIASSTKLYAKKQKSDEELKAEMDSFTKSTQSNKETVTVSPPAVFVLSPITLDTISVGSVISVQTEVDVKEMPTLHAVEITLQPNVFSPVPPMYQ